MVGGAKRYRDATDDGQSWLVGGAEAQSSWSDSQLQHLPAVRPESSLPALFEPPLSPLRNGAVGVSPRPLRTGLDGQDSVRFWLRNNHGPITFPLSLSLPIWKVGDYEKCLSHAWEHRSQASKVLRALT